VDDSERLNVIVVISHDMGQHIGCYGVPNVRTPNLDAFAECGIRFENNFCTAPLCSPSRAALWTGRYPHANGMAGLAHDTFGNDLNDDERHLAQILGDEGYDTHLFGSQHTSLSSRRCGFKGIHQREGTCGKIASAVVEFLEKRKRGDGPLFLQAAFFEPHRPFWHEDIEPLAPDALWVPPYLPDIPVVREDLADLEASCCSVDKAFGAIVKAVDRCGMADDTIVVFTVDHGIPFPHAKMSLYDPGIKTALLMHVPGIEGGKVYKEMISNVDFVPTILDLLGLEIPGNIQGRSFAGLLTGEGYEANEAIFAEQTYHIYYDPMRAIRTEKWKLIANFEVAPHQLMPPVQRNNLDGKGYVEIVRAKPPRWLYHVPYELYDLEADPWEQNDLADNQPENEKIRNELIRRLRQWMRDTGDPLLEGPMAHGAYKMRMKHFLNV